MTQEHALSQHVEVKSWVQVTRLHLSKLMQSNLVWSKQHHSCLNFFHIPRSSEDFKGVTTTYLVNLDGSRSTLVKQASPFVPLMFIAQLPQIPSLQSEVSGELTGQTQPQASKSQGQNRSSLKRLTRNVGEGCRD